VTVGASEYANVGFAGTEPVKLWSVTTLTKMGLGTSNPLVNWNCQQTALVAIRKRPIIDAMLRDGDEWATVQWITEQRYRITEKARIRGQDVHAAAEAIALGVEPKIVSGTEPYVEQLARWIKRFRPSYLLAEAPVYNVEQFYAGTLDGILTLPGDETPILFDYKTTEWSIDSGKARHPFPEVALQLVAYAHATEVGAIAEQRYDGRNRRYYLYDPSGRHEPMPRVEHAICIVISPYDCTAVPVRITDDVWRAFLHVRECARFQERGSHDLFGPELQLREEEA
jgi:hypothetical protein